MKISKIASAFKKNKTLCIASKPNSSEQWISNGIASYRFDGMPNLTAEHVLRMFDVGAGQISDWKCSTAEVDAPHYNDFDENETEAKEIFMTVKYDGLEYRFFETDIGILCVNEKYLKPLYDDADYLSFALRANLEGTPVLAINQGFGLMALICPIVIRHGEFLEQLKRLAGDYFRPTQEVKNEQDEN